MKQIMANGLTFGYQAAGEGPLVLCLHGFPDTLHTWSHLLPALAAHGYCGAAVGMRGYAPTGIPADGDYSALALGSDVLAVASALSDQPVYVVGHDWGALAAYAAANLSPESLAGLVTVAIPHPRSLRLNASLLWRARHFVTFQVRLLATWRLRRKGFSGVNAIYRRWSPRWELPAGELNAVKSNFAEPGRVEAALAYYWSFAANLRNQDVQRVLNRKTAVPTLTIVGDADGALDISNMGRTDAAFAGPYRYEVYPNAGHFPHREFPQRFNADVLAFLRDPGAMP